MGEGWDCCKVCCYSTPYGTVFALSVTVVGLVGFLSSSVYGVALLNATPSLQNNTVIFAPLIGGVAGTTVLPLVVATILAYCITGYVRDELYHPFVKSCVGPLCNLLIMVLTFVYFLLWLGMSVVLSIVTAIYAELQLACDAAEDNTNPGEEPCYELVSAPTGNLKVCGSFGELCSNGVKVGIAFAIALGFSVLVIVGLGLILMVQAANFVSVRECNKRSYRPGGNY